MTTTIDPSANAANAAGTANVVSAGRAADTAGAATPAPADVRGRVMELHALRELARSGPSERATAAQHAKGKLTAHERLALLFDEGTFCEVEQLRRHRATGFGLEEHGGIIRHGAKLLYTY